VSLNKRFKRGFHSAPSFRSLEILARFIGEISIYVVVDVVLGATKLAKRNEISIPQYRTKKITDSSLLFLLISEWFGLKNADHSDKFSIWWNNIQTALGYWDTKKEWKTFLNFSSLEWQTSCTSLVLLQLCTCWRPYQCLGLPCLCPWSLQTFVQELFSLAFCDHWSIPQNSTSLQERYIRELSFTINWWLIPSVVSVFVFSPRMQRGLMD